MTEGIPQTYEQDPFKLWERLRSIFDIETPPGPLWERTRKEEELFDSPEVKAISENFAMLGFRIDREFLTGSSVNPQLCRLVLDKDYTVIKAIQNSDYRDRVVKLKAPRVFKISDDSTIGLAVVDIAA